MAAGSGQSRFILVQVDLATVDLAAQKGEGDEVLVRQLE